MTRARDLESEFLRALHLFGPDISEPVQQYRFAAALVGLGPGLRQRLQDAGLQDWRFDFCWFTPRQVAVECDGGIWAGGRHTRGAGYEGDVRKLNAAALLGWQVYRVTGSMLDDPGGVIEMVKRALLGGNS